MSDAWFEPQDHRRSVEDTSGYGYSPFDIRNFPSDARYDPADFAQVGDGLNPTYPTIAEIAPWQMHDGIVENNWSGQLTEQVLAVMQTMPSIQTLKYTRTLRAMAGTFHHWSLSLQNEIVFVDFIQYNPDDQHVTLMFNQSALIVSGDPKELPIFRFPIQAIDKMAFAVGLYLSYKHCVLRGIDWSLAPIVTDYLTRVGAPTNLDCLSPDSNFTEWMRSFFWLVMGFAPEYVKPPYRIVVYGGCAL